ncbi:unnamed protein product [Boreogadus saida]
MKPFIRVCLREVDANADDLSLRNNVRWLSKGGQQVVWDNVGHLAKAEGETISSSPIRPRRSRAQNGRAAAIPPLTPDSNTRENRFEIIRMWPVSTLVLLCGVWTVDAESLPGNKHFGL